jgi:group I intron endonuclease
MGVYAIRNLNTGKRYVGASTWVERRWEQHLAQLRTGCHPNRRLQGAAKTSGIHRLDFQIIERVSDKRYLARRERYWMRRYNSVRDGYNVSMRTEHASWGSVGGGVWWVLAAVLLVLVVVLG